jgi:hypothetical protein
LDRGATLRLLFATTLFSSAIALFIVQPMLAKMLLPRYGGSAAVWTTCMVFFQTALLSGYLYAHLLATRCVPHWQMIVHSSLLIGSALFLPFQFGEERTNSVASEPVIQLLFQLIVLAGLPLLAISATSPLLQRWFLATGHLGAHNPYALYVASNVGSLLGLLAYPILIERELTLLEQAELWTVLFAVVVALTVVCGVIFWLSAVRSTGPRLIRNSPALLWSKIVRWSILAFVPSSLMLGVTTILATEFPQLPMMWVIPLILYLVSFIIAFASVPKWFARAVVAGTTLAITFEIGLAVSGYRLPFAWQMIVHYGAFFLIALGCHTELLNTRPEPEQLTSFYLWLAVGGVLGGLFNAVLAPAIFTGIFEYPFALIVAALVMPAFRSTTPTANSRRWDLILPVTLGLVAALVFGSAADKVQVRILPALACLTLASRPLRFGLGVLAVFAVSLAYPTTDRARVLFQDRSFFGVSRVVIGSNDKVHWYVNGGVEHGGQALSDDPNKKFAPFLYYHPSGPIGQLFLARMKAKSTDRVGVVGLGAGCLAYYGLPGQQMTFYEIDPLVKRIAEDPKYFTFLKDSRADCRVVMGDARLSLGQEPDRAFGLLVVDAFSGDTIPVHLLTAEAIDLYLEKLAPDGVIAFHISNNYFELEPVLSAIVSAKNLTALSRRVVSKDITEKEDRGGLKPSHWILVGRSSSDLKWISDDPKWKPLRSIPGFRAWSDDYSNILKALRVILGTGQ